MHLKYFLFTVLLFCATASFAQHQNIALHKPVVATSSATGFPASNITDGKISRTSKWEAANSKAPHIIEIDLQKYYNVSSIKVFSGIMDAEKKSNEQSQAAGFWSVKNFKLQYWDDANWSDFTKSEVHENRLTEVVFNYNPAVTTFKIRLICDDGEPINIMEIEAFGEPTPNMPSPPSLTSDIVTKSLSTKPVSATITVGNSIVGKSLKYVGYNQGYYSPGSNISGWVEYSQVNSFRVWASLNSFVPATAVDVDKNLNTVEEFDVKKNELRKSPEQNQFIKWNDLLPLYDKLDSSSTNEMVFSYAIKELKRLKVDVVLQILSTDFDSTWQNKWKQWQRYYALAYYAAKVGDVTMFALQNEPNHRNSGPMKIDQWIGAMQIVSDAIHAAVEDVNKTYNKDLVPKFVGPVTAGQNNEWWAAVAKNIRTDYHGNKLDKDLLEIFSTHSYNSPAVGYESRIKNIESVIQENHPAHHELPIAYTEIGRWMNAYLIDKEETMDSPSLFTEWAGIYANNMKNGGYGMWAFKFANTASDVYKRGVKSGHHFIWQGRRIVEDAGVNIAKGKKVEADDNVATAFKITDGDKSDNSAWISLGGNMHQVVINLGKEYTLGSAVIYSGSAGGVYTAPDRIKNFLLQYFVNGSWKNIPGTSEKDNKYAQVFDVFKEPVTTNQIRFISTDEGSIKLREIKLFETTHSPVMSASYDVSGIQRTGEVVRLFGKGFKDQRPLYQTKASVNDDGLDNYTSFDSATNNYYMWLVQRGGFNYNLSIDLAKLNIDNRTSITAETVSPQYYGEVTNLLQTDAKGILKFTLAPQSVVLLTIPGCANNKINLPASQMATVTGGKLSENIITTKANLKVQLNEGEPENDHVAYIKFEVNSTQINSAQKILLKVNGNTNKTVAPFVVYIYGIPNATWSAASMSWNTAPLLDKREAYLHEVGREAFIAGEIAFTNKTSDHYLDVTKAVKAHAGSNMTFVIIRQTKQLGDDEDKYNSALINTTKTAAPELIFMNCK